MVGETISNYKVIEKIGQGGIGEVYLATERQWMIDCTRQMLADRQRPSLTWSSERQVSNDV